MNIEFNKKTPNTVKASFVAPSANLIGEVILKQNSNVWYNAVLRADLAKIEVGENSNIQDGVICHVDYDKPVIVGDNVTVGHNAVLHGCSIGNGSLIGMSAIILDDVQIGEESLVGAGSLVTQGSKIPPRSLVLGSPAKVKRELTKEEIEKIKNNAKLYVQFGFEYKNGGQ